MLAFEPISYWHIMAARELGWGGWEDEAWTVNRLRYLPMVGYAATLNGDLVGVGAVYWIGMPTTGKALACFALDATFQVDHRSRWVHRRAIEVLNLVQTTVPKIYADLDKDIPKALEFMQRLGFVEEAGAWVRYGVRNSTGDASRVIHSQ